MGAIPVWLIDDGDCWMFVAATTRGRAKMFALAEMGNVRDRDEFLSLRVRKVAFDGEIGGYGAYATVDTDCQRELTRAECAALGWRLCVRCEGWRRHDAEGRCKGCAAEEAAALGRGSEPRGVR